MDLTLNIKVEQDDDARRRLNDVEKAVKGVEDAGKGTETQTVLLAKALSGQSAEAEKVTKSSTALTAQSQQLSGAQSGLMTSINATTAALGLGTGAIAAWTAGALAAAAAATAVVGVLAMAARHYFEHADATKDSRDALKELSAEWGRFQMTVGGALLGSDFAIVRPINALNTALQLTGAYITQRIGEARALIAVMNAVPGLSQGLQTFDWLFSSPNRQQAVAPWLDPGGLAGGAAAARERDEALNRSQGYLGSGSDDPYIRLLERRQKEAERIALEIRTFWATVAPAVSLGLPGNLGYQFPVGASVMGNVSGFAPHVYGMPDTLPGGTNIGPGGVNFPNFWSRAFGGGFGPNLANVMLGSLMGGGSPWASGAAFGGNAIGAQLAETFKTSLGSNFGGSLLSSILPGIGGLATSLLGPLFGKLFGPTDYELRVRQLNEDRQSANQMLATPGLERQWNMLGGNMPFNFAYLQGQAFHDPTAVQGHLDAMLEKTQRLNDAMQRYGISWEDLGEQAKQAHIDTMAEQLILDFEILTKAGADVDFVIEKMGDSVNDFIQSAVRTGSEVPLAMKPLIDRMIELGLLTDESGEAFESAEEAGVTYAKTMTQNFQDLTEAIKHLARALGHDIPDAIDKIPRDVDIDINYRENGRTGGGGGGRDDGGGRDEVPPEAFRGNRGAIVVPAPKLGTVVVDLRGSVIANDAAMDAFVTKIDRALMQRAGAFTRLRTH